MRISTVILLLLLPATTLAQKYQCMNEQDMQKMMQQMQKMQNCMQNVDQSKLKVFEERSNEFEAEIKLLCASGKRDEAQKKAISFGKEMANDPSMQVMRKCGEMAEGMMPKMSFMDQDKDLSSHHVCD